MKQLFALRKKVQVTRIGNQVVNNLPYSFVGSSDFKVRKGVINRLEFVIKDMDKKPVSLIKSSITLRLLNTYQQEFILEKRAIIDDAYKGYISVYLTPDEINNLKTGNYYYALIFKADTGLTEYLHMDRNHDARGLIEILDDVVPLPPQTEIVTEFTPVNTLFAETTETWYETQSWPTRKQRGLHGTSGIVVIKPTNFTGDIKIEGSIESDVSQQDNKWFTIDEQSVVDQDDNIMVEYEGNYLYIRVRYFPSPGNSGSIDEVQFKV